MGRQQKKGKKGAASNFVSRTQALKRLQIKLADFRRLCILKGIYPREPKNKKKVGRGNAAPNTYYWVKDIAYLAHEPLLAKFREYKVFARKLKKALGKHQLSVARSIEQNKPTYTLDHIIRERYPTFVDALRDLDDAMCLLALFARMPHGFGVQADIVQRCERLCAEFQHYVILTGSLQKVFLSIKGIYYQASIMGQAVTWIVPYPLAQTIPSDVDFRVMLTFLELYQTLMGFVNFKLYLDENLAYPPALDPDLYAKGAGLSAFRVRSSTDHALPAERSGAVDPEQQKRLKTLGSKIAAIVQRDTGAAADRAEDEGVAAAPGTADELMDTTDAAVFAAAEDGGETQGDGNGARTTKGLFDGLVFFLNREVPRDSLEFVICCFGGKVGWQDGEASPFAEDSKEITHHVVDRPAISNRVASRDYVQPQWVYDCVNARRLLPVDLYTIGAKLPPHLSPFVAAREVDYDPTEAPINLPDAEPENAAAEKDDDGEDDEEECGAEGGEDEEEEEGESEEDDDEDEDEDGLEETYEARRAPVVQKTPSFEHAKMDEDERVHQEELAAEAAGISYSEFKQRQAQKERKQQAAMAATLGKKKRQANLTPAEQQQQEEKELAKIMMTKRDKRLYNKITAGKQRRALQADRLRVKRAKLAKAGAA